MSMKRDEAKNCGESGRRYSSPKLRVTHGGIIATVLAVGCISSPAAASECSDAADRYNYALDNVSYALNRYTRCLNASQGRDDCSSEFRRLRSAQDDLESAVSEIGAYCND